MKLDQLRKIIREEVRSAVKEELQDVMNEAVKAASAPIITDAPYPKYSDLGPTYTQEHQIWFRNQTLLLQWLIKWD